MQARPRPKVAAAETWLFEHGIDAALREALRPVLTELWSAAWTIGEQSAAEHGGHGRGFNSRDFMEQHGHGWLTQIVHTRIQALAKILAEGPDDLAGMTAAVSAYLSDTNAAELVATTEATRAINAAAADAYRAASLWEVRWQTEDSTACPACIRNQEAGRRPLGVPFPSGAVAPPQHPRCRCALLPA
jgi:hypothetical protein